MDCLGYDRLYEISSYSQDDSFSFLHACKLLSYSTETIPIYLEETTHKQPNLSFGKNIVFPARLNIPIFVPIFL